jgi:hypothetical protein
MSRIILIILLSIITASIFAICSGCGGGNEEVDNTTCAQFVGPLKPGTTCAAQSN